MNKDELNKIKEVIDAFEWQEYCYTGMRKINGGYTKAEMGVFDDDEIEINLEWGEQDMGDGNSYSHLETYSIKRDIVNSDITVKEKLKWIK